jgi:hypothetical protein
VLATDATVELPPGPWVDAVTGAAVTGGTASLASLHGRFPVALLGRPT